MAFNTKIRIYSFSSFWRKSWSFLSTISVLSHDSNVFGCQMFVYPQTYPHNHICTATSLLNFHLYGLGFQAFQSTLRRPALCPQKKSTASAGLLFGVNPVLLPVSEAAPHVSTKNTSTPPGRTAKSQSAGQYVTRPAEGCNVAFDDNTASHCQYTSRSSNAVKLRFLYATAYKTRRVSGGSVL